MQKINNASVKIMLSREGRGGWGESNPSHLGVDMWSGIYAYGRRGGGEVMRVEGGVNISNPGRSVGCEFRHLISPPPWILSNPEALYRRVHYSRQLPHFTLKQPLVSDTTNIIQSKSSYSIITLETCIPYTSWVQQILRI